MFLAIAYIVMGIYIFIRRMFLPVSGGVAILFSVGTISYGFFRSWGIYKSYKNGD
jgi:hypothetical protein